MQTNYYCYCKLIITIGKSNPSKENEIYNNVKSTKLIINIIEVPTFLLVKKHHTMVRAHTSHWSFLHPWTCDLMEQSRKSLVSVIWNFSWPGLVMSILKHAFVHLERLGYFKANINVQFNDGRFNLARFLLKSIFINSWVTVEDCLK